MTIFRAYDVRGKYPGQINEDLALRVGRAFGRLIGKGTVAVGYDVRESSPALKKHLNNGLKEMGMNVLDIGMVPTQLVYFAVAHRGLDGGIMITASHNPKGYNGFKFCVKGGLSLSYGTGIEKIEKWAKENIPPSDGKGLIEFCDISEEYSEYAAERTNCNKKMKVVVDAGNGSAGIIAPKIFRKIGLDVVELFCEPDGNFPNHHPDPLVRENLADVKRKVIEEKADLGIAYDGDGDRVAFIDEKGEIISNNSAFSLLIKGALDKEPGSKILYEILCSKLVEDVIRKGGGVPVLSRVGHSFIQNKMIKNDCVLGGETSGHYYFRENYSYDDGIFASLKLMEFLSRSDKPISEHIGDLPEYITSDDTRIECEDEKKFRVIEHLKKKFQGEGLEMLTIDGVKVFFRDRNSWFVARVSNTQPAIVLRWEAGEREEFERVGNFIKTETEEAIKIVS